MGKEFDIDLSGIKQGIMDELSEVIADAYAEGAKQGVKKGENELKKELQDTKIKLNNVVAEVEEVAIKVKDANLQKELETVVKKAVSKKPIKAKVGVEPEINSSKIKPKYNIYTNPDKDYQKIKKELDRYYKEYADGEEGAEKKFVGYYARAKAEGLKVKAEYTEIYDYLMTNEKKLRTFAQSVTDEFIQRFEEIKRLESQMPELSTNQNTSSPSDNTVIKTQEKIQAKLEQTEQQAKETATALSEINQSSVLSGDQNGILSGDSISSETDELKDNISELEKKKELLAEIFKLYKHNIALDNKNEDNELDKYYDFLTGQLNADGKSKRLSDDDWDGLDKYLRGVKNSANTKRWNKALNDTTLESLMSVLNQPSVSDKSGVLLGNDEAKRIENVVEDIHEIYRSYNKMNGIKGEKGISWFSDDFETMETYLKQFPDREVIKGNLDFSKLLNIDAQGALHNAITYLGDGSDEASKQITGVYNRIQELKISLEQKPSDTLRTELHELELEYDRLSEDTSNLYGTHTTNWFALQAQEAGYLGIAIRNVIDDYNGLIDKPTTTIALFDLDKLENQQRITEQIKGNVKELSRTTFDVKGTVNADALSFVDGKNVDDLQDELREVEEFNSLMKLTEMTANDLASALREVFAYSHENPDVLNNLYDYDSRLVDTFDENTNIGKYFKSMIDSTNWSVDEATLDNIYLDIAKKLQAYEEEYISQVTLRLKEALEVNQTPLSSPTATGIQEAVEQQDKLQAELQDTRAEAEKTADIVAQVGKNTPVVEPIKDTFDVTPETTSMEEVVTATDKAIESKKDFATANEGVQASVDGSKSKLELEAELMESIAKNARDAAKAKGDFVKANKDVKKSADKSSASLDDEAKGMSKVKDSVEKVDDIADVVFKPNTEGFDEIVSKLGIIKEKADEISKITKSTIWNKKEQKFDESYNIKYKDGSSEIRGESSNNKGSNVLRANEVAYDSKKDAKLLEINKQLGKELDKQDKQRTVAQQKRWKEFEKEQQDYLKKQNDEEITKKRDETFKNLIRTISEYEVVKKRIANGEALEGDTEAVDKLEEKISNLQKQPILSSSQLEKSEKQLENIYDDLIKIEKKNSPTAKNNKRAEEIKKMNSDAKTDSYISKLIRLGKQGKVETTEYEKLEKTIKSIINLQGDYTKELDGSEESINKLDKAAQEFNYNLIKDFKENRKSLVQSFVSSVAQITKDNNYGEKDLGKVNSLTDKVKSLKNFKLDNIDDLGKLVQLISEISTGLKQIKAIPKEDLLPDASEISKDLGKINSILAGGYKMPQKLKQEFKELQIAYQNAFDSDGNVKIVNKEFQDLHNTLAKLNAEFDATGKKKSLFGSFSQRLTDMNTKFLAQYLSFQDIIRYGRQAFETIKEYDTALTEMNKVSEESIHILKEFQKESFELADSVGTTASQIQNSTADWMRLGYSLESAAKLAKDANIYANVGDMGIDEATEHMISSVQAWKSEFSSEIEASEAIVDKYNEIGNNYAISSAEIGAAMERSAAALKAGGNTLDESLGVIVAGNVIQQDAETTAGALKILSLRIRGAKADLESMGEETDGLASSTSKMREEIKALSGVDIMLDENTFKSTAQIIKELGSVWDSMSDISQAATLEKIAGKNRASTVAGLIENYELIDQVIESAENSAGSASKENERFLNSIQGKLNQLKNAWDEIWINENNREFITGIIDALKGLLNIVNDLGGLKAILMAIPPAFAAVKSFKGDGKWGLKTSSFH